MAHGMIVWQQRTTD